MQRKSLVLLTAVLLLTIVFSGCSEKNNNTFTSEPSDNTSNVEPKAQHGSLEVEVIDENGAVVSNAVVWLWTQENFGAIPDWTEQSKTTAKEATNSTGKILFSNLDVGEYVISLYILFFTTNEEALAHVKHVTIKANETTHEILQIPSKTGDSNPTNPGGPTEEDTLSALSNGTKIHDIVGDFVVMNNGNNNPGAYEFSFADLKEVDVGVDSKYLYIRYWFNGTWPRNDSDWPNINGDQLEDIICNTLFDTDNNPSTGVMSDGGTEVATSMGCRRNNSYGFDPPYFYGCKEGPTGIEFPEEERYQNVYNNDSFRFGGVGYDYVIGAYPLSEVKLSAGQTVTMLTECETTSSLYHDATFDILSLDNTTTFEYGRVQITLGENRTIP